MSRLRFRLLLLFPLLLAGCQPDKKEPGIYPVGSLIEDADAGGFGPFDNPPKDLGEHTWGAEAAVSVVAFPDEPTAYFKRPGITVRVVNRTAAVAEFRACDSQLHMVREAADADGHWKEVETLPVAICGRSYHRVFLGPNQYWQFPARVYTGTLKTKTRFRLDAAPDRPPIFSNEFDGEFPPGRLK